MSVILGFKCISSIYVPLDELDQFGIRESEVRVCLSAPEADFAGFQFHWTPLRRIPYHSCP